MQVDDVVRLVIPIAGYPDPLGHVRTINGGDGPEGVAYVQFDNDSGKTEPFLIRELEVVDVAELERAQAARQIGNMSSAWVCRCKKTLPGRQMVCDRCGRAKPWREAAA